MLDRATDQDNFRSVLSCTENKCFRNTLRIRSCRARTTWPGKARTAQCGTRKTVRSGQCAPSHDLTKSLTARCGERLWCAAVKTGRNPHPGGRLAPLIGTAIHSEICRPLTRDCEAQRKGLVPALASLGLHMGFPTRQVHRVDRTSTPCARIPPTNAAKCCPQAYKDTVSFRVLLIYNTLRNCALRWEMLLRTIRPIIQRSRVVLEAL
jgi:hypothetical protein